MIWYTVFTWYNKRGKKTCFLVHHTSSQGAWGDFEAWALRCDPMLWPSSSFSRLKWLQSLWCLALGQLPLTLISSDLVEHLSVGVQNQSCPKASDCWWLESMKRFRFNWETVIIACIQSYRFDFFFQARVMAPSSTNVRVCTSKALIPLQFNSHSKAVVLLGTYHILTSVTELGARFPLGKSLRLWMRLSLRPPCTHRLQGCCYYNLLYYCSFLKPIKS